MPIEPGQQLLHYRLIEKIGEGGMGAVWKAVDTTLDREIAIKVLPAAFTEDAERVARFEREARLLASLNHPNIATIHGLHDADEIRFLAMELVRGEDLARRLSRGPLSIEDSVAVCRQVTDAVEVAHEHGVIHRDLKPANVIVAPEGQVKVLDFGLAKGMEAGTRSGDPSASPTLTTPVTVGGMILGTAAYMSPEQARGHPVDRRADIWAFGCLLYECLTGARCFDGETVSDTLAAVLRADPDWSALPASCPPALQRLLRRCLDRDPRRRLRDIGEARVVLEGPLEEAAPTASGAETASSRSSRVRVAAASALVLLAAVLGWNLKPSPRPPLRKFSGPTLMFEGGGWQAVGPSISPDGRHMAFYLDGALHLRKLDTLETHRIEGSEDTSIKFWSPDSRWLAFATGLSLWKVEAAGSTPVMITQFGGRVSPAGGGAWMADGTILFGTGGTGILAVPSQGGDAVPLLQPDEGENDFHEPAALPDGRSIVFLIHGKNGVDDIAVYDGEERRTILTIEGQWLRHPVYAPSGHLLFQRTVTNIGLWAVPFSLDSLDVTGEPFLVAPGGGYPSVAADGTLVYVQGAASRQRQLALLDREGTVVKTIGEPLDGLTDLALSPDGRRVAVTAEAGNQRDIWIYDIDSGTRNRLTFSNEFAHAPRWFPDGRRVAYICGNPRSVCVGDADGGGKVERLPVPVAESLDVDSSGGLLFHDTAGEGTRADLWVYRLSEGSDEPFLDTQDYESVPRISPGGDLLAHIAWELGIEEVFLRQFPSGGGKWQVSVKGGGHPGWSRDEIFWVEGSLLRGRKVIRRPEVSLGPPETLFRHRALSFGYDVSSDGSRFVVTQTAGDDESAGSVVVVENWFEEFADR